MSFLFTQDHEQLRELLRNFFTDNFGGEKIRRYLSQPYSGPLNEELKNRWDDFAGLGALQGGVAVDFDGLGLGLLSNVCTVFEAARALSPLPVLEALLFGVLPLESAVQTGSATEGQKKLLSELISGERILCGYVADSLVVGWGEIAVQLSLTGQDAELFDLKEGHALLESESVDLTRVLRRIAGSSKSLQKLHFAEPRLLKLSQLSLVAADVIGAARGAEELTLEFVKSRKQFGVALGTFQALQHKLADIRVQIDSAESLLFFAGWAKDHSPEQFEESALSAYVHALEASRVAVEQCIQIHGGMGFTWEANVHLFLRRILGVSSWLGGNSQIAQELVAL